MGLFGTSKRTVIISIDELLRHKGVRSEIAPRQYLQALRSLSRVIQREGVQVTAVIASSPLNKAPHNKLFEGVRVRYVKSEDITGGELIKSIKQAGPSSSVLVTIDKDLEQKTVNFLLVQ